MRRDDLAHAVRDRLQRLPPPFNSHYGVVPEAPPEDGVSLAKVGMRLEAAHSALGKMHALAAHLEDPYIVSRILTRREAVSSSSIEGTNSTLDELLVVEEADNEQAKAEAKQVRSYALALDDLVPKARKERYGIFTLELVQSLHRDVMRDDPHYKDPPGTLRSQVVWIGGNNIAYSTWNPPPPAEVEKCVLQTIDYLRNEGMQSVAQGLVTRMAIAHAHFEAVHPFRDGNGRVGRLLLPLMMAAEGHVPLYLSPYIEANKAAYSQSLKDAQQRLQWDAIVGFVADAIVGTVDDLMITRQALADLSSAWKVRRKFRKGSAALRMLDELPHYPVVTANRVAEILAVSVTQANQAVAQLLKAGILTERTGYTRNRMFSAREALAVINRPFGAEPAREEDEKSESDGHP